MDRPPRHPSGFSGRIRPELVAAWLVVLSTPAGRAQEASTVLTFADDRISVAVVSPAGPVPEQVLSVLPIAMKSALEQVGAPVHTNQLTIRLQAPSSLPQRTLSWFRTDPAAVQRNDEIRLHPDDDPLKLAFRIGHELSHWLVYKQYPARPPLWLDEGLAQIVAADAARACARPLRQDLARPLPAQLDRHLLSIDDLTALQAYPRAEAPSAAFYWQAERLVQAIRDRLGSREFSAYLALLCSSNPPVWQIPLRERWYFTDWDVNWLAEQIRPGEKGNHVD